MVKRFFLSILFLLFCSVVLLWGFWYFQKPKPINAIIIDKTVLNTDGIEHKSYFWILNHERFVKNDTTSFDRALDYYGFFPKDDEKFRIKDFEKLSDSSLMRIANSNDMIYYADTYGMYRNEWYGKFDPSERSRILYGGLSSKELFLLKQFKEQKKLVIAEYNLFALPTSESVRKEAEIETKIKWTGWTGRYFDKLDTLQNTDLPNWVVRNYKKQNNGQWPFKNGGIVFNHANETIAVLEEDENLEMPTPIIQTKQEWGAYYNLPEKSPFTYWFDIVSYENKEEIKANYYIFPTVSGDSILKKHGLPNRFPAIIEQTKPSKFYYFAGDFGDNPINYSSSYFDGISYFKTLFYKNDYEDRRGFFWKYYKPLVSKIQLDYYKTLPQYKSGNHLIKDKTYENRTKTLSYKLGKFKTQIVLSLVAIYCSFAILFLSILLITRKRKKIKARKNRILLGNCKLLLDAIVSQNPLSDHLTEIEKQLLSSTYNKQLLINCTIIEYSNATNLEDKKIIWNYYSDQGLLRLSLEKLKSFQRRTFFKGVIELTQMNIKASVVLMMKILEKEKDENIIEALDTAILSLRPIKGLGYILKANNILNEWQQLNILVTIAKSQNFILPPLLKWLEKNDTLKILGCRLVALKKVKEEMPILMYLLDTDIPKLKVEVIKALVALEAPIHAQLILGYPKEKSIVKIEILKSFLQNAPSNSIDFLKNCAIKEKFELRKIAVQAIHNLDPEHHELNTLLILNIPELNNIISQVS